MNENSALRHLDLLAKIREGVLHAGFRRASLSPSLLDEVLTSNDEKAFTFLIRQLVAQEGRVKEIPLSVQKQILSLAEKGQLGELKMFIKVYPFDFSLHHELRVMVQNRDLCLAYIKQWPLADYVLDLFWSKAYEVEKAIYVSNHEVSKEMGLKVWKKVGNNTYLLEFCKIYLHYHPVPRGLLAMIINEPTKSYELRNLIDYSNQPFYPEDEITLVSQDSEFLMFYLKKFGGLSEQAQVALLSSGDDNKICCFAEKVGVWMEDAQQMIVRNKMPIDIVRFIAEHLCEPFNDINNMRLCEILH